MKTDKDRPSTWVKFRQSMCNGCRAGCCTMPVEVQFDDLVMLGLCEEDDRQSSMKKLAKKLIREHKLESFRDSTGLFMLGRRPNGDCTFLHPITRLCTVYDKRPQVCRKFPEIGPRPGYCPVDHRPVSK